MTIRLRAFRRKAEAFKFSFLLFLSGPAFAAGACDVEDYVGQWRAIVEDTRAPLLVNLTISEESQVSLRVQLRSMDSTPASPRAGSVLSCHEDTQFTGLLSFNPAELAPVSTFNDRHVSMSLTSIGAAPELQLKAPGMEDLHFLPANNLMFSRFDTPTDNLDALLRSVPSANGTLVAPEFLSQAALAIASSAAPDVTSFLLQVDGQEVVGWSFRNTTLETRHHLHSANKSITSLAVGAAVDDGLLSADTSKAGCIANTFQRRVFEQSANNTWIRLSCAHQGYGCGRTTYRAWKYTTHQYYKQLFSYL